MWLLQLLWHVTATAAAAREHTAAVAYDCHDCMHLQRQQRRATGIQWPRGCAWLAWDRNCLLNPIQGDALHPMCVNASMMVHSLLAERLQLYVPV